MSLPKIVKGPALKYYFLDRAKPYPGRPGFYKVVKPLYVFKKTNSYDGRGGCVEVITNLIIPVGAVVYAPDSAWWVQYLDSRYRKMRASKAIVHSQALRHGSHRQVDNSRSGYYNYSFIYKNGTVVKPKERFSYESNQCDSGIHFFLNLADAYHY